MSSRSMNVMGPHRRRESVSFARPRRFLSQYTEAYMYSRRKGSNPCDARSFQAASQAARMGGASVGNGVSMDWVPNPT